MPISICFGRIVLTLAIGRHLLDDTGNGVFVSNIPCRAIFVEDNDILEVVLTAGDILERRAEEVIAGLNRDRRIADNICARDISVFVRILRSMRDERTLLLFGVLFVVF